MIMILKNINCSARNNCTGELLSILWHIDDKNQNETKKNCIMCSLKIRKLASDYIQLRMLRAIYLEIKKPVN
jgi:hypothetical protein